MYQILGNFGVNLYPGVDPDPGNVADPEYFGADLYPGADLDPEQLWFQFLE